MIHFRFCLDHGGIVETLSALRDVLFEINDWYPRLVVKHLH